MERRRSERVAARRSEKESGASDVVAPVNGVVVESPDTNSVRIYIAPNDEHTIFAPVDGSITDIRKFNGSWHRKVFQAYEEKTARVTVEFDTNLDFWVEVGKPLYITDRIRLDKGVSGSVIQGEPIGEILLGSLAEVHFLDASFAITAKAGDKVVGGKTGIATRRI